MRDIPEHLIPDFRGTATETAVIQHHTFRFTILTPRVIRIEQQDNQQFEDRPSQPFWYRQHPKPEFAVEQDGSCLVIQTEVLRLTCEETLASVQIQDAQSGELLWQYGQANETNLRGTARTLDDVSGNTQLEEGLIARAGWNVVDDSHTLVFEDGWLMPRTHQGTDLYFFAYGADYRQCLRDYAQLTGQTSLLPRWAFGNWWSRYWDYSAEELRDLMTQFQAHEVPLSVCIIDMDWHLEGWTGYTWNTELFPDPPAFLDWLHEQGLKTALNLHPADGVGAHEAMYEAMAQRMGRTDGEPVPFDIADPAYMKAYFELLHHPHEEKGIDFWWIDWQQGEVSKLPGLDPLWLLNHLHFYDLARDGKRPFIFSRWGGLGNHRYPLGFSGDTHVDWESLSFQPYFTATAANVNYGWWSHDIGGHMFGIEDRELYTRWVQFGVFSPIMRLHSTKNRFHERRPWGYDAQVDQITSDMMRLRHALIPYLYTLSWQNVQTAVPPIRPMYYDYPEQEQAYVCPDQYTFGDQLIVAPYIYPADEDTRLSRQVVWLPEGDWYNFFTGEFVGGDKWLALYGDLEDVPVFARAGAIIPMGPKVGWGGVQNPDELHLACFAGADGSFALFEDDGDSQAYLQGEYGLTEIKQTWQDDVCTVQVGITRPHASIPAKRTWVFQLFGVRHAQAVSVVGADCELITQYDEAREVLTVQTTAVSLEQPITLTIHTTEGDLLARRNRQTEQLEKMLWAFKLETMHKEGIAQQLTQIQQNPQILQNYAVGLQPSQKRALLELLHEAGVHHVVHRHHPDLVVLWNNQADETVKYHLTRHHPHQWDMAQRFQSVQEVLPRFKAFTPDKPLEWQVSTVYTSTPHTVQYRHDKEG